MKFKELVFNNISKLPNSINTLLLKTNKFPNLVYGKLYTNYKNRVTSNEITLEETQAALLAIVNHGLSKVSFYRDKYGIEKINAIDEFFSMFDFIDKDVVIENFEAFVQDDINYSNYLRGSTGGTSGKPMQMLIPRNRHIVTLGSVHGLWSKFGYHHHARAVLRNQRTSGDYIINPVTKEYIFDGFDMSDENFELMYSVMKRHSIQYLQCYPSSGYEFATYLKKTNCDTSFIKAFFVSSENVFDHQRALVKNLGISYFSLYGHSEKLVLAGNCPHSDYYHITPGYGFFELIDEDGHVIKEDGITGEIVGTSLHNYGFPLLRYRTGDYSEYITIDCACGYKGVSLKSIYGRWSGARVYNRDGSFVTTTALNLHSDLYSTINGMQYVQDKKGALIVNIIPGFGYNEDYERRLYEHFRTKLNADASIIVRQVSSLKRQENGKFLLLLSTISP